MLRNEISNGTKPHASPLLTPERLFGFFLAPRRIVPKHHKRANPPPIVACREEPMLPLFLHGG